MVHPAAAAKNPSPWAMGIPRSSDKQSGKLYSSHLCGERALRMVARTRDLNIVFPCVTADVAAVFLMGWNDAAAGHVLASLRLSVWHDIFPFFYQVAGTFVGLPGFLVGTAIARHQTGYRNRNVKNTSHGFERCNHTRDWGDRNDVAVTQGREGCETQVD
jgi:hypothetical protein